MNNNANINDKKDNVLFRLFQWFKCRPLLTYILIECLLLVLYFFGCGILFAFIAGVISLYYIVFLIYFVTCKKIERDKLMVKERYWKYLICLVVAIPIAFAILLPVMSPEKLYDDSTNVYLCNQCGDIQSVNNEPGNMLWTFYYYFIDPGNQHSAQGFWPKFVSAVLAISGIFLFNGLLVTTILGLIDRRKDGFQNGRIRYSAKDLPTNKFAVVIGANEIASSVIKNLLKPKTNENTFDCLSNKDNEYVILQTSSDVQKVRDVLASHLTPTELDKVIIYNALRDSELEIAHLHLEHATEIYILGENTTIDGGETYHDAMNMRCLNLVAKYLKTTREEAKTTYKRKACRVMFDYQTTYSVFQFSDVSVDVKETLVFIPFNRYESWARKVLVECVANDYDKIIDYVPLDGYEGIKYNDDKRVHFVIVGMSKMGIAMGVQALLQLHFPNYVRDKSLKSRITFIDTNADKEMAFFKGRYATLFELVRHRYIDANKCKVEQLNTQDECSVASDENEYRWIDPMKDGACKWKHLSENGENFLDVEIEFIKGELESDGVRNYLKEISKEELNSKLTIAICLTQTHQAVAAALYMPIEVYNNKNLQQILVYQREADDIVKNLLNVKDTSIRYNKLRPFGMLYGEYMETRCRYYKAQLINMAYDNVHENIPWPIDVLNKEDIGTNYMREIWRDLAISLKISNKFFGDTIYQKIRSMMNLHKVQAVGGYHNAMYDNALLRDELISVLHLPSPSKEIKNNTKEIEKIYNQSKDKPAFKLAICEHNRWNIEKLLMGFSPMNEEQNTRFLSFVNKKESKKLKEYKACLKSSAENIHPNICDFDHLKKTDSDALWYDVMLHNSIPNVLLLVDGYKTSANACFIDKYQPEYYDLTGKLICKRLNINMEYYQI